MKLLAPVLLLLSLNASAQVMCPIDIDRGPLNRAGLLDQIRISPTTQIKTIGQRFNGMSATIDKVTFWGRTNPASGQANNQVTIKVFYVNTGPNLPGGSLPNNTTTVTIDSSSTNDKYVATFSPGVVVNDTDVIITFAGFFGSDDFYIQRSVAPNGANPGLMLLEDYMNGWFNQISLGASYDYDFLIIPAENTDITANFSSAQNGPDVDFSHSVPPSASFFWDFGDGNTTNASKPTHTYDCPGTYAVTFKTFGTDTTCKDSSTQNVTSVLTADFTSVLIAAYSIQFTNASLGAVSYLWDFGDGNTSTDMDPLHVYADSGTYSVSLTSFATDTTCTTDTTKSQIVAGGVGINELQVSSTRVYPSLVQDRLIIIGSKDIVIYNHLGLLMFEGGTNGSLDVSAYPSGLYILADENGSSHRFLKY